MSLKLCLRTFPVILNSLKSHNFLVSQTRSLSLTKCHTNFLNTSHIKFYSTARKNEETPPKVVYYGMLTPQIKAVKLFSLSSSIVGIIAQPFLYKEIAASGNVPVIVACYSFIGFFTFVTPILLHFITRKYVTHLEFNESTGKYIARTVNFFCVTRTTEFKPEEIRVPEVPGMFTSFTVNGKGLFIDPRQFEDPMHYAKLMGYDKPLDFKLYEQEKKG